MLQLKFFTDLRLVRPQDAQTGRTLANEVSKSEEYEMLKDLKDYQEMHDLAFNPDELA